MTALGVPLGRLWFVGPDMAILFPVGLMGAVIVVLPRLDLSGRAHTCTLLDACSQFLLILVFSRFHKWLGADYATGVSFSILVWGLAGSARTVGRGNRIVAGFFP